MTSNIKTYDVEYFLSQQFGGRKRELPMATLKLLNISTKINMNIDQKRLEKLKTLNIEELEKKINGNLNKLTKHNIKPITILIKAILEEKKDVLLDYTVKNLLNKAISQPTFCDIYADVYKEFHCHESKIVFDKLFKDLIDLLENKYNNEITDKNYDLFCKNIQDKTRFMGLFHFISTLYHIKIIDKKILGYYIDYLFNKLESENADTEKYVECLCRFLTKINDKEIFEEKIQILQKLKGEKERISSRYRFMIMDLLDLYKKM
jgi:hypothetical protein